LGYLRIVRDIRNVTLAGVYIPKLFTRPGAPDGGGASAAAALYRLSQQAGKAAHRSRNPTAAAMELCFRAGDRRPRSPSSPTRISSACDSRFSPRGKHPTPIPPARDTPSFQIPTVSAPAQPGRAATAPAPAPAVRVGGCGVARADHPRRGGAAASRGGVAHRSGGPTPASFGEREGFDRSVGLSNRCSSTGGPCRLRTQSTSSSGARSSQARAPRSVCKCRQIRVLPFTVPMHDVEVGEKGLVQIIFRIWQLAQKAITSYQP
jgi:hypothetical protein